MKLVLVEHFSEGALEGEPSADLLTRIGRYGQVRAYRGDNGVWYPADSVEPKKAATPRYAVVRMGEVAS